MPHVCPWWVAYLFDNRLVRRLQDPGRILAPYIREGMTVADIGAGMGRFTVAAARLVGDEGVVIAADLQQKMLDILAARATKAGVAGRVRLHQCQPTEIGLPEPVDLILLCNVVHEAPDAEAFLREVHSSLRPGRMCFLSEPAMHVTASQFEETVALAEAVGFTVRERLRVRFGRTVLLAKG
jgi:ubiquinone/menaquinone biosynthesis C-methylase UbiE